VAFGIQVVFDAANPDGSARFWAEALGYVMQPPPEGFASWEDWLRQNDIPEDQWDSASAVVDPDGKGPRIYFQKVPEPKTVKNRLHLDINVGGGRGTTIEERRQRVDAEVLRLLSLGAKTVRPGDPNSHEYYTVMQDPEGNEFCVQ
jgi:hypothetical protein